MSAKLEYSRENLLKQVSPKYHSIIKIFMKSDIDIIAKHKEHWDHKIHLKKGKKALFICNYKPLSAQEIAAMKKYIDKHLGKDFI